MPDQNKEIRLRELAERLTQLMIEVANGNSVDREILDNLDKASETFYIRSKHGTGVTEADLDLLDSTIALLERSIIINNFNKD